LKDLPQRGPATEQKKEEKEGGVKRESVEVRKERLRKLGRLHGLFLLFFSGVSIQGFRSFLLGFDGVLIRACVCAGRVYFDFPQ
jgi:hypothetical protein